jgi:preprotein translocase YajC subunit
MSPTISLFIQVSIIIFIYGILAYSYYMLKSMKYIKTQRTKFEEIHKNIEIGRRVLLNSGLIGVINSIDREILKISLNNDIQVEASIYSVQSIL